jgi:hypothetical protein
MLMVVAPLGRRYAGPPSELVRPMLHRAWLQALDAELPEPIRTRCARAIEQHRLG